MTKLLQKYFLLLCCSMGLFIVIPVKTFCKQQIDTKYLLEQAEKQFYLFNLDSSLVLAQHAIDLSTHQNDSNNLGFAFVAYGKAHCGFFNNRMQHLDTAFKYLNNAMAIAKQIDSPKLQFKAQSIIIPAYYLRKDYYNAYLTAENLNENTKTDSLSEVYIESLLWKAKILNRIDLREESKASFLEAYNLLKNTSNYNQLSHCLFDLGVFYQDSLPKSIELIKQSIHNAKLINNNYRINMGYDFLALINAQHHKYDSALHYYWKEYEFSKSINFFWGMTSALLNIVTIKSTHLPSSDSIEHLLDESLALCIKYDDPHRLMQTQTGIGGYYFNTKNYTKAKEQFLAAFNWSYENSVFIQAKQSAQYLFKIDSLHNNFSEALKWQNYVNQLSDSISNHQDQVDKIRVENIKQLKAYKSQNLSYSNRILKQKHTMWLLALLILILLFMLVVFVKRYKKTKARHHQLYLKAIEFSEKQQELISSNEELKAQLENYNQKISKTKKAAVPDHLHQEIIEKLNQQIEKKVYLSSKCTLAYMAKKLGTNTSYLSSFINDIKEVSFKDFINELRISEAVYLLKNDKSFAKYTTESMANEVGYNSKTAFVTSFKKQTGLTPAQFLKSSEDT